MSSAPVMMQWDGEAFRPANSFWAKRCDKQFVVGERYSMTEHHERSGNSHRHYFAAIHEAWTNLPEKLAQDFPSSEHLRKWALMKAGYCKMQRVACRDNHEAIQAGAIMGAMDTYAVCEVSGAVVTVWRADSQSVRAMPGGEFQKSKEAVLRMISELIGSDIAEHHQAAA